LLDELTKHKAAGEENLRKIDEMAKLQSTFVFLLTFVEAKADEFNQIKAQLESLILITICK
jgi:hypothetical protein